MSEFQPEPKLILHTKAALLVALSGLDWFRDRDHSWRTKSVWLCELIGEIAKTQYPYNSLVQREAERRLGIAPQPDSGSPLSRLVYNAQKYQRHDQLVAAGYQPLSQAMLEAAFATGAEIELHDDGFVAAPGLKPIRLKVRHIDGQLYAMKPRKRKWAVQVLGQPAKIVRP